MIVDDDKLTGVCTVACERMRGILQDAERAHPHAPYSALVNLIADVIMSHETPEDFYAIMLEDIRSIYVQKLQFHMNEAAHSTIN